jgi:hypothetical protein
MIALMRRGLKQIAFALLKALVMGWNGCPDEKGIETIRIRIRNKRNRR